MTFFPVDRKSQPASVFAPAFPPRRLWAPMWSAEQRRRAGGFRRGLFEARRAEFRSRPARRVAQGSRRSRPRSLGSPFLCLLSFGEAKESKAPSRRNSAAQPPARRKQAAQQPPKQNPAKAA